MNASELEHVIHLFGVRAKGGSGGKYIVSCPIAHWTHSKGGDKNPSCTMLDSGNKGFAIFKCWACGNQGTVRQLAKMYRDYSGDGAPLEYVKSVEKENGWSKIPKVGEYEQYQKKIGKKIHKEGKPVKEEDLKAWMDSVPKYALKRGITMEQINRWEIGYDKVEKRLIFTIRDFGGKFVGVSGRDLTGERDSKYKHYPGTKKETVLYGEKFTTPASDRGYIVEGFTDVLGLERMGVKNPLGSMGSSLSEIQMKKLAMWFKEVVFFPDGDFEGLKFAESYSEKLKEYVPKVGIAGVEPNSLFKGRTTAPKWESENFKFVLMELLKNKDPDDLTKEEIDLVTNRIEWI